MPWTVADVDEHKKGLTDDQKKLWVKVANDALARCEKKKQSNCDARAIKQASAVAGRTKEALDADFEEWFEGLTGEAQDVVLGHTYRLRNAIVGERSLRKQAVQRIREMGVKLTKEAEVWSDDVRDMLRAALHDESPPAEPRKYRYWVKDVSVDDKFFVYEDEQEGGLYKRAYTISDEGKVTLGDQVEVRVTSTYSPVVEASEILGDIVPLVEGQIAQGGVVPIKLIGPGWGTSGYYSSDVLERDGAKVFPAGTPMFWDHPTPDEEKGRPEGSLKSLAAKLTEPAQWQAKNPLGPGLYSKAEVFSSHIDAVQELSPHIGVSIRGLGRAKEGEAEGKEGLIIEEIVGAHSVDFVTQAGAGGKVLQLFEAARREAGSTSDDTTGGNDMEDLKALQEAHDKLKGELADAEKAEADAKAENAKLKEAQVLQRAKGFVGEKLAKQDIPDMTRARIADGLAMNPPVKDGELDEKALEEAITEAVKGEVKYLADMGLGSIKGMGGSGGPGADSEDGEDRKKVVESWQFMFEQRGSTPEEAERMAKISAQGR